jgi:hypothetical protein
MTRVQAEGIGRVIKGLDVFRDMEQIETLNERPVKASWARGGLG